MRALGVGVGWWRDQEECCCWLGCCWLPAGWPEVASCGAGVHWHQHAGTRGAAQVHSVCDIMGI